VLFLDVSPDTVRETGYTVIAARISDDHAVAEAEYFIDVIGAPGTGLPARAVSGFGSPVVDILDTIYTTHLEDGSHYIYLHGRDNAGSWGPVDSVPFFKEARDTIRPRFAIALNPASPTVGSIVRLNITPSEPLHPDSTLACSLKSPSGITQAVALAFDTFNYTGSINTQGFQTGTYRLSVMGYDRWSLRGSSSLDFVLAALGDLLPQDLVYVWPNPVSGGQAHFHYYVNANAEVTAEVYTLDGKLVARLQGTGQGGRPPHGFDSNAIIWDASHAASDVYILRLTARSLDSGEKHTVVKKFAVVK